MPWIAQWREAFRAARSEERDVGFRLVDASHPSFRKDYVLRCPCCHDKVQILEQESIIRLQKLLWIASSISPTYDYDSVQRSFGGAAEGFIQWAKRCDQYFPWSDGWSLPLWACDACIASGRAENADFEHAWLMSLMYDGGSSYPYFYFDHERTCDTCHKPFVYTKGEQRWAHEVFVVKAYNTLRSCPTCRREKRDQHRLQRLVHHSRTDADPYPALLEVLALMRRFDDPRLLGFLRRAKNKAPTLEERHRLEAEIAEVTSSASPTR
jgi:Probable zinc-ribbon domain